MPKLIYIGLIVIAVALFLGNLAVCAELTKNPQTGANYTCEGLLCYCEGNDNCTDMFTNAVCGDVPSCNTTNGVTECSCFNQFSRTNTNNTTSPGPNFSVRPAALVKIAPTEPSQTNNTTLNGTTGILQTGSNLAGVIVFNNSTYINYQGMATSKNAKYTRIPQTGNNSSQNGLGNGTIQARISRGGIGGGRIGGVGGLGAWGCWDSCCHSICTAHHYEYDCCGRTIDVCDSWECDDPCQRCIWPY